MARRFRMELRIESSGLGRAIKRAIAQTRDLGPLFEDSADILEASTDLRFDTGIGPGGIPWPRSRRAAEQGGKTLVDRGLLRGSMTREVGEKHMEFGVDGQSLSAKYADTHQHGRIIRPVRAKKLVFTGAEGGIVFADEVTIPVRPFIGIDDQDSADLEDHWTRTLEGAFDGTG
jgi:phage gpG-like protein